MKLQKIKLGFTLIELLVVITIIGILATWATAVYTTQIQKARDSTRLGGVTILVQWIEQFYQDDWSYPVAGKWVGDSWSIDVKDYVPNLVRDPKDHQACWTSRCWYAFIVANDVSWITNWAYEISTAFESPVNRTTKASTDWWDDDLRYETFAWWMLLLDTAKDIAGNWGTVAIVDKMSTVDTIHIWSISATILTPVVTDF